jgi:hypothetical protein
MSLIFYNPLSSALISGIVGAANDLVPPAGYVFLVDSDGAYLTDSDGNYLMEAT